MKTKKVVLMVLAAVLLFAQNAYAGETEIGDVYNVGKGDWLVGAATDVNRIWGGGVDGRTTFTLQAEVGYFIWDWFMPEMKLDLGVTEGFNSEIVTVGIRAYWNRRTQLLPYARINMGVGSIKFGDRVTRFALNPGIGLDYLLGKNVAIGIQANYQAFIAGSTTHRFDFPIGFSIYF